MQYEIFFFDRGEGRGGGGGMRTVSRESRFTRDQIAVTHSLINFNDHHWASRIVIIRGYVKFLSISRRRLLGIRFSLYSFGLKQTFDRFVYVTKTIRIRITTHPLYKCYSDLYACGKETRDIESIRVIRRIIIPKNYISLIFAYHFFFI